MKRLLVLMLVLGFAGAAEAVGTLDLVITSWGPGLNPIMVPLPQPVKEITISPSEWIGMDIIYIPGTPPCQAASFTITAEGMGTLDISTLTLPDGAWDFNYEIIQTVTEGKAYNIRESYGMIGQGVVEGIAIDHILLHCDSPEGDVIVTIVDWVLAGPTPTGSMDYGGPIDVVGQVTVHVPEPMTVALLGLGGLFLLRRRK